MPRLAGRLLKSLDTMVQVSNSDLKRCSRVRTCVCCVSMICTVPRHWMPYVNSARSRPVAGRADPQADAVLDSIARHGQPAQGQGARLSRHAAGVLGVVERRANASAAPCTGSTTSWTPATSLAEQRCRAGKILDAARTSASPGRSGRGIDARRRARRPRRRGGPAMPQRGGGRTYRKPTLRAGRRARSRLARIGPPGLRFPSVS